MALLGESGEILRDGVSGPLLDESVTVFDAALGSVVVTAPSATISVSNQVAGLQDDLGNYLRDDINEQLLDDGSTESLIVPDLATIAVTGQTATISTTASFGTLTIAYDPDPEPDEAAFTLSVSATGTLFWLIDDTATRTPGEIIAGGTVSGSFAVTSGSGSGQIDTGATATGTKYLHAVVQRTSDSALTNADSVAFQNISTHDLATITVAGQAATILLTNRVIAAETAVIAVSDGYRPAGYGVGPYGAKGYSGGTVIIWDRIIGADAAAITLTFPETTIVLGTKIEAETATISVTGNDAEISLVTFVSMDTAAITVTGQAATVLIGDFIAMDAASVTVAGQEATILVSEVIAADAATITITGLTGNIITTGTIAMAAANINVAGPAPGITVDKRLRLPVGQVNVTGQEVTVRFGGLIALDVAAISISGKPAIFVLGQTISMATAGVTVFGPDIVIDTADESGWADRPKNADNWTDASDNSDIWTDASDNTDTWTDEDAA